MKKSSILILSILLSVCAFFTSCNTIKAVPLAYSANEDVEVSYIYFELYKKNEISGATYITYDNKSTPKPEKFTYWSPVEVPANTPIKLTLKVYYKEERTEFNNDDCFAACLQTTINAFEASRDVDREITFNVPPLEPDCEYTISYKKGSGFPGNSYVTLTRNDTKEVIREIEFN